jgi:hypothetical protein
MSDIIDEDYTLSPEEVKKSREDSKKREAEHNRFIDDIRWVISKPQGRRIVYWLLAICGLFRGSFIAGEDGDRITAFNEGKKDIGLQFLINLNEANPTCFLQMQTEYLGEKLKERKKEQVNG